MIDPRELLDITTEIQTCMKAQYLKNKNKWTAFMTLNGLDIHEYGNTEQEARTNLANRIAKSEFLLKGIKTNL